MAACDQVTLGKPSGGNTEPYKLSWTSGPGGCGQRVSQLVLGHGGVATVATATGLAASTIRCGRRELRQAAGGAARQAAVRRVRQPGGGRTPVTAQDPALGAALEALVAPVTRGDPRSPLRWTCKSPRKLAEELTAHGHPVSRTTVAQVLEALG